MYINVYVLINMYAPIGVRCAENEILYISVMSGTRVRCADAYIFAVLEPGKRCADFI